MQEEINAVTLALNQFATHYSDSDVVKWGLVFTASWPGGGGVGEQVLLATDLAARGIDITELNFIIHYHLPLKAQEFSSCGHRTRVFVVGN